MKKIIRSDRLRKIKSMDRCRASHIVASIFSISFLLYGSVARATYEIYFTNNTADKVSYRSFLKSNQQNILCSDLDPNYYHAYSGVADAYQKVKLFDVDYDKGMSKEKLFCLQSRLTIPTKTTSSDAIIATRILGASVGSEIKSVSLTLDKHHYPLFVSKPYPHPVALVQLNNLKIGDDSNYSFYAAAIRYFFSDQSTNELDYVLSLRQDRFFRNDNDNQLAIGTYNVQLWPFYANTSMRMNEAKMRAQLIPLNLTHYDVVVLEELMDKQYRDVVSTLMKRDYPYQVGPTMDNALLSGGTVIYSHWPILKQDSIIYQDCNKLDCGSAKGALYIKIKKGSRVYNIFGTHLQATEGANTAAADRAARDQQFIHLRQFIKKQKINKNQAVVIAGDLNIDYQACSMKKDCEEYQQTILAVDKNYAPWNNISSVPFGSDPSKNLMNTDPEGEMEDYALPVSIGYLAPTTQQSRIRVIREPAIPIMYDGGSQILHNPFGNLDLSDHFMLESMLSYPSTKKISITSITNTTREEKNNL